TVRDLTNRWGDDVSRFKPDWLSIKIGINDLHRWLHKVEGQSVTVEEFEVMYDGILQRAKKETKAQILLMDPFYLSVDKGADNWRGIVLKHLPAYIKVVHAMAKKY